MTESVHAFYKRLKTRGLTERQDATIRRELAGDLRHAPVPTPPLPGPVRYRLSAYGWHDMADLQGMTLMAAPYHSWMKSIDDLLEKDKQREKDGFPRKIRVGKMIRPGRGTKEKVVVVPSTVEEKLYHDPKFNPEEEDAAGGSGDGDPGEVIGEQPVRPDQDGSGSGPGQGEGETHEVESSAYDLGRILTERFELPNLKDKGKKRSLTRYTYDLTDKNRGFGQVLDKKATLRKILETNIALGRVPNVSDIDATGFLIGPKDRIYRVLSREKDYESQAMIFFLRDYSGSMSGKPTELVVSQHVLIYSWLTYQYERQVETRFILHDTEAKEVEDFYTYYNSKVAGGTKVAAAFRMVNEIVAAENLAADYNIYVFHGTDGDDWDTEGRETVPEIKRMLTYANRVGVTIAERSTEAKHNTEVERYLKKSGLLEEQKSLLRLDTVSEDADEDRLIDGIRSLIS